MQTMEFSVDSSKKISRWTFGKTFVFRPYYKFIKPADIEDKIDVQKEVDRFFINQSKIRSRFERDFDSLDEALKSWKVSSPKIDPSIYFTGFYKPNVGQLKQFKSILEDIIFYLASRKYNGKSEESVIRSFGYRLFVLGGLSPMYCTLEIFDKFLSKTYINFLRNCWEDIGIDLDSNDKSDDQIPGVDYWS